MLSNIIYIAIILWFPFVQPSHFYGGSVTWKPMNNTASGSQVAVMFTQSYQWRRTYTYCNQSYIVNQSPLIPLANSTLDCVTTPSSSCGGYNSISINEYCTDFSAPVDSSSGQTSTTQNITIGSEFCVAFQGSAWIGVESTACGSGRRKKRAFTGGGGGTTSTTTPAGGCYSTTAGWSIGCCVNLTVRSEGFINTPPVATIISVIQIPVNTLTNILIPVIDADNDFLRCRWAAKTSELDECGDVCQMAPGSTLDRDDCMITYDSTNKTVGNYYAVALMVEDFADNSSNTSFSSVPIQFLIHIVNISGCSLKPIISSILSDCTPIQVGVQFSFTLTITQGCSGTTLADVYTMPPLYMYKGIITQVGTTNVWTVTETWTPSAMQLGSQVYCAVATDSAGIQSDQYCLTFTVVAAGAVSLCPGQTTPIVTTTTTSASTTTTPSTTSISATTSTGIAMATTMTIISTTTTETTSASSSTSISTISATTTTATTTSNTSATTATTIIIASTTAVSTNISESTLNIPLIIGLSLLPALVALFCCCCCCLYWWLCYDGAARRRRRLLEEEEKTLKMKKTSFEAKSSLSRKRSLNSTKSASPSSRPTRFKRNINGVNVNHLNRINKPLPTEQSKTIKHSKRSSRVSPGAGAIFDGSVAPYSSRKDVNQQSISVIKLPYKRSSAVTPIGISEGSKETTSPKIDTPLS